MSNFTGHTSILKAGFFGHCALTGQETDDSKVL